MSIGGLNQASCGSDFNWRSCGGGGHGSRAHGGGHSPSCTPGAPFPPPPANYNPFPPPPSNCGRFPPGVGGECGHNSPGIETVDWGGAQFVDTRNRPGIALVNWGGAAFVDLSSGGTGGCVPPPCIAPPSVCNGTLTFGQSTFSFNGSTLNMTNTCTGETTCVWGDPHITNPDGSVSTVDGNFTFDLGDGTQVTVIASNGVQNSSVLQGCVGENSLAIQVVVTNGQYTATMNPDSSISIACGANDPARQQGLQLTEQNQEWTQQPLAMA